MTPPITTARLLDLAGALSVATDLGNGQAPETAIRLTRLALRLADAAGARVDPTVLVWAGLLRFAGCVATSPEEASFGGDDLVLRAALLGADLADPEDAVRHLSVPGVDLRGFLERGPAVAPRVLTAHCEVAVLLAARLGLPPPVLEAIGAYHERFDGRGPLGLAAEGVPLPARLLAVAQGIVAHRGLSREELRALLRARAGSVYDPALVEVALRLGPVPADSGWAELEAADGERRPIAPGEVPALLRVLGDWADLKAPCFAGHARAVARLAAMVARSEGEDAALLASAGAAHDLGRVAVPNAVWEAPRALDAAERERMATHPSHGARVLARLPGLEAVARLVAVHHERPDGRGYPSSLDGSALSRAQRILAAADAWVSLGQGRPHRPAFGRDAAIAELRASVASGALCARAVAAVLDAAGAPAEAPALPAGLSGREAEVLALVARGLTNKEVAGHLGLSPRTVQQHTLRIYRKLGVSTRAAATLFAAGHDLV